MREEARIRVISEIRRFDLDARQNVAAFEKRRDGGVIEVIDKDDALPSRPRGENFLCLRRDLRLIEDSGEPADGLLDLFGLHTVRAHFEPVERLVHRDRNSIAGENPAPRRDDRALEEEVVFRQLVEIVSANDREVVDARGERAQDAQEKDREQ
jgi:hypothetical protein